MILLLLLLLLSLLLNVNSNNNLGIISNSNSMSGLRIKSYIKDQEEAKLPWPATFFVNMLKIDKNKNNKNLTKLVKSSVKGSCTSTSNIGFPKKSKK